MSGLQSLPPNPLLRNERSPPPRVTSPPARGFSRSGFAPIPYRHSDLPAPPREREREREFPRRDLDPDPQERRERRMERDDWERERRAPPPHWEDDYGGSRFPSSTSMIVPTATRRCANADISQIVPSAAVPPPLSPRCTDRAFSPPPLPVTLNQPYTTSLTPHPSTVSSRFATSQIGSARHIRKRPRPTRRSFAGFANSWRVVAFWMEWERRELAWGRGMSDIGRNILLDK